MRGRSFTTMDPPPRPYNAGTERVGVFTDQADIARTKREAERGVFGEDSRMKRELFPALRGAIVNRTYGIHKNLSI